MKKIKSRKKVLNPLCLTSIVLFMIFHVILLVVVLLCGFKALDYARGDTSSYILLIMVHMVPALVLLEVWGVIMYLIYRIRKSA